MGIMIARPFGMMSVASITLGSTGQEWTAGSTEGLNVGPAKVNLKFSQNRPLIH
jgi:hypothetical protein